MAPIDCSPEEVIFYVGIGQLDIFMGDKNPQTQCSISSIISNCKGIPVDEISSPPNGSQKKLVHRLSNDLYGNDANVTISKLNITCSDTCDEKFYIPTVEHTGKC